MVNLMKKVQKFWEFGAGRTTAAAFCAHSVSISIGICQGYSSILIPQLTLSEKYHLNSDQSSWIASLGAISNPIGSILSGLLAEWLGRKLSMQLSCLPFLIGWLCISLGDDLNWIYAGRFITGISAGMSSACYTYVSEISNPEHRGVFQALGPICASFGILMTYILGYVLDWLYVARLSTIFCALSAVAIQFFPESPAYIFNKGNLDECFESYYWFRRNINEAREEVEKHTKNCDSNKLSSSAKGSFKENYLNPCTVKPFVILIALFFLQELSGIYSILFYTVNFFEETNTEVNEYYCSILVGVIRFVVSILAAILINKFGRKTLCVLSSSGMSCTMLFLCVYFKYYEINSTDQRVLPFLTLVFVMLNVTFSMIGMLPIPWILVGELFPLNVRSIMSGVVICIAQCFIFICVKVYPDLVHVLGFSGALMTFLGASLVTIVYCKMFLPETKNKSLQEIENYFKGVKSDKFVSDLGVDNKGFVPGPELEHDLKRDQDVFTINVNQRYLCVLFLRPFVRKKII